MTDVVCLRPEADFARVGVVPPAALDIRYLAPDDPALPAALQAAQALVIPAVGPKLPTALFEGSRIRLVQVTGAGVDRVDAAALRERGIAVTNVPGGSSEAVAEYAVACATVLLRRFPQSTAAIRRGDYARLRAELLREGVSGLGGLLVGVAGMGVIGTAVARRFHQSGARIAFFDPAARDPAALAGLDGAAALDLDELLETADIVTLHVPLLPATENLFDAARLARMKPGAILIQASRGGVVDEAALAAALESGRLGGAAVDVYSTEPPAADTPLLALSTAAAERLILTPHVAGVTRQSWALLFRAAWDNVVRVLVDGNPPEHAV